jgi:hypothetical protein
MIAGSSAALVCCGLNAPAAIHAPPDPGLDPGLGSPLRPFELEMPASAAMDPRRLGRERDRDPHGWFVPDFAKLQTGGFVGFLTIGVGYGIFDDVVNIAGHYGYTPPAHAGHDVHTLHLTLDVRPFDLRFGDVRWIPAYMGGGLLHVWGEQYFSDLPHRYAKVDGSYYPPTALHWTAHLGTELDWLPRVGFFERHGFYFELATVDTFVFAYSENRETVSLTEVVSSTIGYRAAW